MKILILVVTPECNPCFDRKVQATVNPNKLYSQTVYLWLMESVFTIPGCYGAVETKMADCFRKSHKMP